MMRIHARTLLGLTQADLWSTLTGPFTLVMDDGEIETNAKECQYSSYVWEIQRAFPNCPITLRHHVQSVLKAGRVTAKTHMSLIENCLWDTYDYLAPMLNNEEEKLALRFRLAEMAYRITNTIYNELSYKTEEHVMSIDITDFVELLDHPAIVAAYDELKPTQESFSKIYGIITNTLRNDPSVRHNPISKLTRSGLVSDNQIQQCLGPRGFVADADERRIENPIMRGYAEGMRLFHDSLIESRSAAKAMMFSKGVLQDSEYFSRRLQFISMAVENLHHTDCGSGRYIRWTVRGPLVRDGKTIYGGDLRNLAGSYYVDEEDGNKLKMVKGSDKHLIGRKIKMRNILFCQHPDPAGVCSTCFGGFSDSVPPFSNLGHMCSAYITQQSSQMILSVKHLDGSAEIEAVIISDGDRHYIRALKDGNSYAFADGMKSVKLSLVIPAADAANLTDIYEVEDVSQLSISRVSELMQLGLRLDDGKKMWEDMVDVYVKPRSSSMTHEMLRHIKEKGWTNDERGNFVISMEGWDFTQPITTLPMKYFNVSDHSKEVADMLESSVDDMVARDRFVQPESLLGDLFQLVNEKLSVNIAPLSVVLYSATIVSAADNDYSLPKPDTRQGLGVMRMTMDHRSLGPRMAYERHYDIITRPISYALTNRPDHVLDTILMPREVIASGTRTR